MGWCWIVWCVSTSRYVQSPASRSAGAPPQATTHALTETGLPQPSGATPQTFPAGHACGVHPGVGGTHDWPSEAQTSPAGHVPHMMSPPHPLGWANKPGCRGWGGKILDLQKSVSCSGHEAAIYIWSICNVKNQEQQMPPLLAYLRKTLTHMPHLGATYAAAGTESGGDAIADALLPVQCTRGAICAGAAGDVAAATVRRLQDSRNQQEPASSVTARPRAQNGGDKLSAAEAKHIQNPPLAQHGVALPFWALSGCE
jgi:hypothetical protein